MTKKLERAKHLTETHIYSCSWPEAEVFAGTAELFRLACRVGKQPKSTASWYTVCDNSDYLTNVYDSSAIVKARHSDKFVSVKEVVRVCGWFVEFDGFFV